MIDLYIYMCGCIYTLYIYTYIHTYTHSRILSWTYVAMAGSLFWTFRAFAGRPVQVLFEFERLLGTNLVVLRDFAV